MARKYARDNRGRFAAKGTGATARGGRLKTAGGNKREGQTIKAAGGPAGTVGKPRGLKPGAIQSQPSPSANPLQRTGNKTRIPRLTTNLEQGRRGVVSMSPIAKTVRRGNVADRRSQRLERITERQAGIVARRQNARLSPYKKDGSFDQSVQNLNQSRLNRSKTLQESLRSAGQGAQTAFTALNKKRKPRVRG
jgi:hypothetical protein